jgi:hypothetical protein
VVVDLDRDEVALGDALLPRCTAHPYVARLTARLRWGWGLGPAGPRGLGGPPTRVAIWRRPSVSARPFAAAPFAAANTGSLPS